MKVFDLFLELSLYAIPVALVAGIVGFVLPGVMWAAILSAAIVLAPAAFHIMLGDNQSHPGKMGGFLFVVANIFWAEVALWTGFVAQLTAT